MNNRTAIITGAAKRIGAATTRELHRMGMDVIVHFNTAAEPARQLAAELNELRPESAHLMQADLRQAETWPALIDTAVAINGRLDVLINNASAFYPAQLEEISGADWDELMDVNLKAPFFLAQAAAPYLAVNAGCIINLTDIHADRPLRQHLTYSVSKAGLEMLTRALALELAPGVRVNAIAPGAIFWHEDMSADEKKEIMAKIPMNKLGQAEDIAAAVRYLVDAAPYTTGQVLVIDGGRSLVS